ncbi:unnamed protein product [Blumeria hordei]|uniref:JmjC domain-containing protein n=1 Tax=Blumeria hordei TaxID=2867405 RepID=A0A383UXA4_BLUHO|nr:unnamed protein product [Blumeria hordei]
MRPTTHSILPRALQEVDVFAKTIDAITTSEFRDRALHPAKALLFSGRNQKAQTLRESLPTVLPAINKWFVRRGRHSASLSLQYLSPFAHTLVPYEIIGPAQSSLAHLLMAAFTPQPHASDPTPSDCFHQFHAPLSLLLHSSAAGLYVAQASLQQLPEELKEDLPVPRIVREAGRGDIYDANLWLGNPPTYTPLHKDPNPNLFCQLAGRKRVRLYSPRVGLEIFRKVRSSLGNTDSRGAIRGREMMEGFERMELERTVWGPCSEQTWEGMEVDLEAGDSLFIPEGWWHTIRGLKEGVEGEVIASVNWWFR